MERLLVLYKKLSAKYPDILFGYKLPDHRMFYTFSVFDRKRHLAKYDRLVAIGLSDQDYVDKWLDLVRGLYEKEA